MNERGRGSYHLHRLNKAIELAYADDERDTIAMPPLTYAEIVDAPAFSGGLAVEVFPRGSASTIEVSPELVDDEVIAAPLGLATSIALWS